MTADQQRETLDKFLKSLQGAMNPEALAKAQAFLDPTKPENQSIIDAITIGSQRGWMAQDDYQRRRQEVERERQQLEALRGDFLQKQEALQNYKEYLETNFLPADQFEAAQQQIQLLQSQLQMASTKLEEYGEELAVAKTAPQPQVQSSQRGSMSTEQKPEAPFKYVTVEQNQALAEQLVQGTLMGSAQMLQMMQEHQALTGQTLNITDLTTEALKANRLPADYWAEKYQINDLRQKFAERQRQAEIEEQAKALAAKMVSAQMETGQGGGLRGNGNPIFGDMQREPSQRSLVGVDLPQDRTGFATDRAAVEAYMSISQTGKLPDGTPVHTSPSGF